MSNSNVGLHDLSSTLRAKGMGVQGTRSFRSEIEVTVRESSLLKLIAKAIFSRLSNSAKRDIVHMRLSEGLIHAYMLELMSNRVAHVSGARRRVGKIAFDTLSVPSIFAITLEQIGIVEISKYGVRLTPKVEDSSEFLKLYSELYGVEDNYEFAMQTVSKQLWDLCNEVGDVQLVQGIPDPRYGNEDFMLFCWTEHIINDLTVKTLVHPYSEVDPAIQLLASFLVFQRDTSVLNPIVTYNSEQTYASIVMSDIPGLGL